MADTIPLIAARETHAASLDLEALARQIADSFPPITSAQKAALGQLLRTSKRGA
ncbi:hypothetical protein [Nesterenkonia sp. CF4.4]|uniref:hypothetical protein n=1 Tax=Nesterenkonia sp. CF4.4 TaxID=3373079 RepID=UPI003EE5C1CB